VSEDGVFDAFSTEDATVWIDPLDGTSDFVRGDLTSVTILIGLAVKGVSKVGIVHSPFCDENPDYGRTLFATLEHGAFKLYYDPRQTRKELLQRSPEYIDPFNPETILPSDHKFLVVTTMQRFSPELKQVIETIRPSEVKRVGGAGNKCCYVALGHADTYISFGLAYWDICAPEVIIKAMGGFVTNLMLEPLNYDYNKQWGIHGMILAKTPAHHRLICKRLKQLLPEL
jgi:3'(2'), 5'-bisphosphate nucleotidase